MLADVKWWRYDCVDSGLFQELELMISLPASHLHKKTPKNPNHQLPTPQKKQMNKQTKHKNHPFILLYASLISGQGCYTVSHCELCMSSLSLCLKTFLKYLLNILHKLGELGRNIFWF